ncbi:MAG: glycosyltransferase family 4 protein [Pseudomonadales bacterium]
MQITFALPNLRLYGGIKSTMQMAESLQQLGHDVTVVYPRLPGRDGQAWWRPRKTLVQLARWVESFWWHPDWVTFSGHLIQVPMLAEKYLPEADILILTWWADVAKLHNVTSSKGKVLHFVRSYETWGGPPDLVEKVYALGIPKVANSEQLARQLPVPPISTIHNGIDENFFNTEYSRSSSTTMGFLYRLQDWKQMDDAIEVAESIIARNPEVRLLVFGEALKRDHAQRLHNLRNFEYIHLPSGPALKAAYEKIDIFLFTSDETEAFGNPPLEAMAAGCAVVATKVGAVPAYSVDQQTALHCEVRDCEQMVAAVQRLLDNTGFMKDLANRAQDAAQHYRWIEQAKLFEAVLANLVNESNDRSPGS